MRIPTIFAGLSALALSACAQPMVFQAPMNAAYEVPPTNSRGVGTVVATVYPTTRAMTYEVNYKDLTGPAIAAHFHGPAAPGANGPVVVPSVVAPAKITGGATLTEAQLADLQAGRWYYNIHTATNPNGEIRGNLVRAQ